MKQGFLFVLVVIFLIGSPALVNSADEVVAPVQGFDLISPQDIEIGPTK